MQPVFFDTETGNDVCAFYIDDCLFGAQFAATHFNDRP